MTGFIDDGKGNLKKLMRIALVGIKPADQILLKGYLRVLLRLEVDFEWVAANHENVDLFMINKEFRQASSVIKLLSSQPQKPVLYISRTDADEGSIKDNQLILPLKTLQPLNEWLLYSVAVLKHGAGAITDILQKNQRNGTMVNSQDMPTPTAQRSQPPHSPVPSVNDAPRQLSPSVTPSPRATMVHPERCPTAAQMTSATSVRAHDYQGFIILIQQLQQRPAGLYHIVANQQVIAIVEPSHARIWLANRDNNDNTPPILSLDWQLQSYTGARPQNHQAADLIQYLWQYAWIQADLLLPLVSDEASYQLRYWIKPVLPVYASGSQNLAKKDRQNLLSVMTALEFAPYSVNQLATMAHISVKSAKKIIASLLFSGSLTSNSYSQLYVQVSRTPMFKSVAMSATNTPDTHPLAVDAPLPATAHSTPTNRDASRLPAQSQKGGFLASLRLKLGL